MLTQSLFGASHLFRVSHEFNAKTKLIRQTVNAIIKLFRAKIAHWQIDELDDTQIRTALLDCSSSEQMCALLYNLECLIQKKQHCFIKENSVFKFLDEVLSVSCQTKFIYMVRDPRDMALSWKNGPVMRGAF